MSTTTVRNGRVRSRLTVRLAIGDKGAQRGDRMSRAEAAELYAAGLGKPRSWGRVGIGSAGRCPTPDTAGELDARHGPRRVLFCAIVTVFAAVLVSACGSSGKPHTQAPPSSPTQRSSATSANSSSSSPAPATATSPGVTSHPTTPTTTSSAAGATSESAVQVYLAYNTWVTHAAMNPTDPNVAALANLASGAAYSDALKNLNSSLVWKGIPATPRVRVTSVQFSATVVNLTDCAVPGSLLPYYVATGKAVPLQANPVPPPYLTTAQVVNVKGHWSVTQADTDRGHTCTP